MSTAKISAALCGAFNEAAEVKAEPPRPLTRELPPADPFPVEALGDVLGSAASVRGGAIVGH